MSDLEEEGTFNEALSVDALTEQEKFELSHLEAVAKSSLEMSSEQVRRLADLLTRKMREAGPNEHEYFTYGAQEKDPSVKTMIAGSGTVTRYRIVGGKKQIIDECRPIRTYKALRGDFRFYEPIVVPGVGVFILSEETARKILAGDPEATALAEKFGVEPHVSWRRRYSPDRRKQTDNPESQAVPQGSAAEAVSEMQANDALAENRRRLTRAAIGLTPTTGEQRDELAKTLGVADPKVKLSPEEIAARQAHHDRELENAGRASEPLQFDGPVLPTETA